jgi:hypothetical protein
VRSDCKRIHFGEIVPDVISCTAFCVILMEQIGQATCDDNTNRKRQFDNGSFKVAVSQTG